MSYSMNSVPFKSDESIKNNIIVKGACLDKYKKECQEYERRVRDLEPGKAYHPSVHFQNECAEKKLEEKRPIRDQLEKDVKRYQNEYDRRDRERRREEEKKRAVKKK
ncbi:hypothetical protein HELRODRAFT_176554 [Helobdella robusta]|uniref:Uncharacterized protein n=1 Tax=Helobdella robusta TaxID=6412 RepID=T1FAN2_HELRO|nr:hypothetical protein HELRODRAFT_176554 [Helobdella robusta]ESN99788.1 hypothetical protein HELRODRAFT_176554 [Helobdella robusta]